MIMLVATDHARTGKNRLDLGSATAIAKRLGLTKSGPVLEAIRRSTARLAASEFIHLPPSPAPNKMGWMLDLIRDESGQMTQGHILPDDQEVLRFRLFDDVSGEYRDTDRLIVDVSEQFSEICQSTIAVPASIMAAVGKSPLQLDFASFLIYRLRAKRVGWIQNHSVPISLGTDANGRKYLIHDRAAAKPEGAPYKSIPLALIAQQLGSVSSTTREFSESAKECLRRIIPVWPSLNCEIANGKFGPSGFLQGARLILRRSPLPDSPLKRPDLDQEQWFAVDGDIDDADDGENPPAANAEDRWADPRWDMIDRDEPAEDHGYIYPPAEPDDESG